MHIKGGEVMNDIIEINDCEVLESMSLDMDDYLSKMKVSSCDSAY